MSSTSPSTFETTIERFVRTQEGRNRSPQTLRAYRSDLTQRAGYLHQENAWLTDPADVTSDDINDFLAHLSHRGLSGVSRARKLAAVREFFRYLKLADVVTESPVEGVDTPKRERRGRSWLSPEEYNRLLAAAGGHPRDFCAAVLVAIGPIGTDGVGPVREPQVGAGEVGAGEVGAPQVRAA